MSDRTHHAYQDGPWTAVVSDGFLALVEPDAPWRLVDGLWQVARDGGDVLGALGVVAADGFASLPAFAVLRADGDGAVHAVLRGAVRLRLHGVDGTQEVAAGDGAVWTEHRALGVLGLELVVDAVPAATWWPLTGGVVRAGGLRTGDVPDDGAAAPAVVPSTATHAQPVVPEAAAAPVLPDVVDADAVPGGPLDAPPTPQVQPAHGLEADVEAVHVLEPGVEPAHGTEPDVETVHVAEPEGVDPASVAVPLEQDDPADRLVPDVPPQRADALEPDEPTVPAGDLGPAGPPVPEPAAPVDPWAPAAAGTAQPVAAEPVAAVPGVAEPAAPVEPDLPTERLSPEDLLEAAGPPAWSEAEDSAWSASGPAEPVLPEPARRPEPEPEIPWWPLDGGGATSPAAAAALAPAEPAPAPSAPDPLTDDPFAPAPAVPAAHGGEAADSDDHDGMTILSSDLARLRDRLPAWSQESEPGPFPVAQPAPLAARMVLSTGLVVALDRAVLLGRAPQVARVSNRELPRLVTVPSPNQDISRTHAEVRVEGDHVIVTDLDSTNGVHVSRPGEGVRRLHPGEPSVIGSDEVVDLGDGVTFTVERSAS